MGAVFFLIISVSTHLPALIPSFSQLLPGEGGRSLPSSGFLVGPDEGEKTFFFNRDLFAIKIGLSRCNLPEKSSGACALIATVVPDAVKAFRFSGR
jgi:hypothetical protein